MLGLFLRKGSLHRDVLTYGTERLFGMNLLSSFSSASWLNDYSQRKTDERLKLLYQAIDVELGGEGAIAINEWISSVKSSKETAKTFLTLRQDLLQLQQALKESSNSQKELLQKKYKSLDVSLIKCIADTFSVPLVELREITAHEATETTLRHVLTREKVLCPVDNTVAGLKARLSQGRRCYGLFHVDLPEDPLVFVHVALTNEFSASLRSIDSNKESQLPQYAIFYSINASYTALKNLGLPQRLLTETKHFLQTTYPHVHTFSTLSPIPGFLTWLRHPDHTAQVEKAMPVSVQRSLQMALEDITSQQLLPASVTLSACARRTPLEVLVRLLHHVVAVEEETREEDWSRKEALLERFKEPLLWLCAHYLVCATRPLQLSPSQQIQVPYDEVANFHLRNGASCYRLNWAGDGSSAGRARAAGLMVNYLYASSVHARYEEGDTTGEASKVNEYSNSSEDSNKSEKKVGRRWRVSVGPDIAEILSQV